MPRLHITTPHGRHGISRIGPKVQNVGNRQYSLSDLDANQEICFTGEEMESLFIWWSQERATGSHADLAVWGPPVPPMDPEGLRHDAIQRQRAKIEGRR